MIQLTKHTQHDDDEQEDEQSPQPAACALDGAQFVCSHRHHGRISHTLAVTAVNYQ
jgi:hypothetical protein